MFRSRRSGALYRNTIAFCTQLAAEGYQFLRVDLTSSEQSCAASLQRHFEELRRRIERTLGFHIEYFKVKTSEGYGTLHCIFASKADRRFYIDHSWLKAQWDEIHRASIVYVKKVKTTQKNFKRIAGYFADEHHDGKIVRMSWSMKALRFPIGKTFKRLYRIFYKKCHNATFRDLIVAWQDLLIHSQCVLDGIALVVVDRKLKTLYEPPWRSRRLIEVPSLRKRISEEITSNQTIVNNAIPRVKYDCASRTRRAGRVC